MKFLAPLLLLALGACGLLGEQTSTGAGADPVAGPSSGGAAVPAKPASEANPKLKDINMDSTKRFEIVDVYVVLGDTDSQRQLVPYLMKPEEWMLVKAENHTPTFKHYQFQRIISQDGRAIPSVDPFKKPPPPPSNKLPGRT